MKIISFAGKGGTGKTTIASLTMRALTKAGLTPVLGIDADPNSCLGETIGVTDATTIGQVRERFKEESANIPAGMSKEAVFQMKVNEIIVEGKGWDLLVMGRPEGPGCYCYINNVLRKFLETLGENYKYVVMDNEAGLEHLSRHNTGRADFLFIVVEPTVTSLRAARRISELSEELGLVVKTKALIINRTGRMDDTSEESLRKEIETTGLEVAAQVPFDERLSAAEIQKVPFMELKDDLISLQAVDKILEYITSK